MSRTATRAVANSLSDLQKVNVDQTGDQATPTTAATLSVNLPSTASVVPSPPVRRPGAGRPSPAKPRWSPMTTRHAGDPQHLHDQSGARRALGNPKWEVDVYNAADAGAGGGFPYSARGAGLANAQLQPDHRPTGDRVARWPSRFPNGQTMSLNMGSTTQLAAALRGQCRDHQRQRARHDDRRRPSPPTARCRSSTAAGPRFPATRFRWSTSRAPTA